MFRFIREVRAFIHEFREWRDADYNVLANTKWAASVTQSLHTIISNQHNTMAAIDDVKHILEEEAAEIATIAQGVTALETQLTATEAIVTDLEAKASANSEDADLAEIATAARQNLTAMQSIAAQLPTVPGATPDANAGDGATAPSDTSGN